MTLSRLASHHDRCGHRKCCDYHIKKNNLPHAGDITCICSSALEYWWSWTKAFRGFGGGLFHKQFEKMMLLYYFECYISLASAIAFKHGDQSLPPPILRTLHLTYFWWRYMHSPEKDASVVAIRLRAGATSIPGVISIWRYIDRVVKLVVWLHSLQDSAQWGVGVAELHKRGQYTLSYDARLAT